MSNTNTCPYCKSNNTVSTDAPKTSLNTKWDIEQLCTCLNCEKDFITTYKFSKNVKLEESSIYA